MDRWLCNRAPVTVRLAEQNELDSIGRCDRFREARGHEMIRNYV